MKWGQTVPNEPLPDCRVVSKPVVVSATIVWFVTQPYVMKAGSIIFTVI